MQFLLNDVVFNLSDGNFSLPPADSYTTRLKMSDVIHLGSELFSGNPNLPHDDPARSLRLIGLILSKASTVSSQSRPNPMRKTARPSRPRMS